MATGRRSSIGTAYVSLVPSFDGFFVSVDREMTRKIPMIMEQAFKDVGKNIGKDFARDFEQGIGSAIDDVIQQLSNQQINLPAPNIGIPVIPEPSNMQPIQLPAPTMPPPSVPDPLFMHSVQLPAPAVPVPIVPAPAGLTALILPPPVVPVPVVPPASPAQATAAGTQTGQAMGAGIGQALTAVAGSAAVIAIGAKLQQSFMAGLDKEAGEDKLAAQLNLSGAAAEKLAQVSDELYKDNFGESREVINGNLNSIVGSIKGAREASTEELEKMGADAANLSSAFGLEATELSATVSSMITNGIAKDWDQAVDIVTAGYQDMSDRGNDWSDTLKEYSGDFAQFGLSGEQALGAVSMMVDEGGFLNTDTAADALRESGIQARSGENAEFLEAIGMDPKQVQKDANTGGEAWLKTFQEMMVKLKKKGNKSLYGELIGTQAEDQLNSIIQADWSKLTTPIGDISKRTEELNEQLNGNTAASLASFMRSIETLFIQLVQPAIAWLSPKLKEMTTFLTENKWAVTALGIVIGVVLVTSAIAATVAFWAMMAPFLPLIGTVLLVVGAIALLGVIVWAVIANWETIVAVATNLWGGFINWFSESWGNTIGWLSDIFGGFFGWLGGGFASIGEMFMGLGSGIANFFIGIINGVIKLINMMIDGLNSIQFQAPDWMGGFGFAGFGIPTIAEVPMMKDGGTIMPKGNGIATLIGVAEAGKPESVVDSGLLNKQLAASAEHMSNSSAGGSGGGTSYTYNVHQLPGESTEELVRRIEDFKDIRGDY